MINNNFEARVFYAWNIHLFLDFIFRLYILQLSHTREIHCICTFFAVVNSHEQSFVISFRDLFGTILVVLLSSYNA